VVQDLVDFPDAELGPAALELLGHMTWEQSSSLAARGCHCPLSAGAGRHTATIAVSDGFFINRQPQHPVSCCGLKIGQKYSGKGIVALLRFETASNRVSGGRLLLSSSLGPRFAWWFAASKQKWSPATAIGHPKGSALRGH
jgi:hypothetical protein